MISLLLSKKQPCDFVVREVLVQIVHSFYKAHLDKEEGAMQVFSLFSIKDDKDEEVEFLKNVRVDRPFRRWIIELEDVSRNVFWVWNHDSNVIDLEKQYNQVYEAPLGFIGGIETEATSYVAAHIHLINELLEGLPLEKRQRKRLELQLSGLERIMGLRFRKSSQKFHKKLHEALREWIVAAKADDWPYKLVQTGST